LSVDFWALDMSKPKLQAKLAALSFSEKIKILEKLRDREKAIAASGLRRKANAVKTSKESDLSNSVGLIKKDWKEKE
jgi:hypothetical protein